MIRIREIIDPDLRERVRAALSDRRGGIAIPDWYELDDMDYVDLLNDLRDAATGRDAYDPPDDHDNRS